MVIINISSGTVLKRLKNKAKEESIPFQQLLNLFCQEEFIRKLSQSKYADKVILKGGLLLYLISEFTTRPTVDADFLLENYSNDIDSVEKMVKLILNENTTNDFIKINIRNIEIIGEENEYHGIRVNLLGNMGKTKTPFSIDFIDPPFQAIINGNEF